MVPAWAIGQNLPVVFIAGPTASGKTGLAIELAKNRDVDLISVDAAQVYRGMDIGTAKLSKEEQAQFPHQLIDIREPWETYDASQFRDDALRAIARSHAAGRLPVLVGGTLFYFSALEKGVSKLPKGCAELRAKIEARADVSGWDQLHQKLSELDPVLGTRIQAADRQRVSRAWEIYELTGEVPSVVMRREAPVPIPYPVTKFALFTSDRKQLHQRITERFEMMLEQGLIEEVKALIEHPKVMEALPSMRCVGYRQTLDFLKGEFDQQALCERGAAATRQLAKRQLTWLRHQSGWVWLQSGDPRAVDWVDGFL